MQKAKTKEKNLKKKIIAWSLIAAGCSALLFAGVGVAIGYGVWHSNIIISQSSINKNNGRYKIKAGTEVWFNDGDSECVTVAHDLFNLKLFSQDHNDTTVFTISGTINFGFLVDFDMNCHLSGINNELTKLSGVGDDGCVCGVIVGSTSQPTVESSYSKSLIIDSSMTFSINSELPAYGVWIDEFANNDSTHIIDGTFLIVSSSSAYGVYFSSIYYGHLIVSGVFTISANNEACGVKFLSTGLNSTQIINGVFTILSEFSAYGVLCVWLCESLITVSGVFSICASLSWGCCFGPTSNDSMQIINGCFTVVALSQSAHSVFFDTVSGALGSLLMNDTQFFSNKVDSSNIFQKIVDWDGTYKWNGEQVKKGTGDSVSVINDDKTLQLTDNINDNDNNHNFFIKVIKTAKDNNQLTFNDKCVIALLTYINRCSASSAKPWLESIVSKIIIN